jgi:hypothetical protein
VQMATVTTRVPPSPSASYDSFATQGGNRARSRSPIRPPTVSSAVHEQPALSPSSFVSSRNAAADARDSDTTGDTGDPEDVDRAMRRLYFAATMADAAIVAYFRKQWKGLLSSRPEGAYELYDALVATGDAASGALAATMQDVFNEIGYTRAAAEAAQTAHDLSGLSGLVPCTDADYRSAEEACADAALAYPYCDWIAENVRAWFPSYVAACAWWNSVR